MKPTDIVHESKRHFVKRLAPGRLEVYCNELTHSVRCAQINFPSRPDHALQRAIAECERREAND